MRVEKITTTSRLELLIQINGFLKTNGWNTFKKSDEMLYARDSRGGGLVFKFIEYMQDPNYGYAESSSIYICKEIDESLNFSEQADLSRASYFKFKNGNIEFSDGFLIGDENNFILYIDNDTLPYPKWNLFFACGYLSKTHEFNGGRVSFSSMYDIYNGGYNWGGYTFSNMNYSNIPFSRDSKTIMDLGGQWRHLRDANLENSKLLTNLCEPYNGSDLKRNNELSAIMATPLLSVGKSKLSGLYTLVTPNFFYKNNQNIWVHAGEFKEIRVLRDEENFIDRFKNGQILHLGNEKFMLLRPHTENKNSGIKNIYTLAVKIA